MDPAPNHGLLFDAHPQPMWVFHRETRRLLAVNAAAVEALGFGRDELLAMRVDDLAAPTETLADLGDRAGRAERSLRRLRRKDGADREVELDARDLDWGGQPAGIVLARDVTDARRAEAALRASEARFRRIVETAYEGVWIIDADARITYANHRLAAMLGWTPEEMLGRPLSDFHDEDWRRVTAVSVERRRRGVAEQFECTYQRRDGTALWVSVAAAPLYDDAGRYGGALAMVTDLTERRRAEAALRASEARFRRVVDSGMVGIFFWGLDGGISDGNDAFLRIVDCTRDELRAGAIDWQALTPPEYAAVDAAGAAALRATGLCPPYEKEYALRDGRRVDVLLGAACFEDDPEHGVAFVLDITERKRAEAEVRALTQGLERRVAERTAALEAANRELEAFTYTVSHDLRSPVRAMVGFSRIVLEECREVLPEASRQQLGRVVENATRMGRLIDELLGFSRLGRRALAVRSLDPAALAREVLGELQGGAESTGLRPEVTIAPMPRCRADPALLRQVFVNLLGNALKFTSHAARPVVEVGCRDEGGERVYFVRDNGAGFDMRYASKLFGVFQRLHRETEYPGTGVGLAIVQRIVHRHGGRVWAEGAVGQGATFYFTLPEGRGNHG